MVLVLAVEMAVVVVVEQVVLEVQVVGWVVMLEAAPTSPLSAS
jgi:hypothetical protein